MEMKLWYRDGFTSGIDELVQCEKYINEKVYQNILQKRVASKSGQVVTIKTKRIFSKKMLLHAWQNNEIL